MSSDTLARVDAFSQKGDELAVKGHVLRAAENYGRAVEVARALGADNLVATRMKLQQGNVLSFYIVSARDDGTADPRILAAHRAEAVALFSGAVAALERRRVEDTLLEGKCTAVEEAWCAAEMQRNTAHDFTASKAASLAALVGYEVFLRAAANVSCLLVHARRFAAECSDAQFQSFAELVVRAADMMQLPRRHENVVVPFEPTFTEWLRNAVLVAGANGLDERLVQLITGALQRLQRSGVLQTRRIEQQIQESTLKGRKLAAAVDKSLTAPGLCSCALPGCGATEAHPTHFKSCSACRTVVYCCREHQVAGWPAHKKACKAARRRRRTRARGRAAREDGRNARREHPPCSSASVMHTFASPLLALFRPQAACAGCRARMMRVQQQVGRRSPPAA